MQEFIEAVRKQLNHQNVKFLFSLNQEIYQVIQLFHYKTLTQQIEVVFLETQQVDYFGNPLKFYQVITNLLSNAIDAYDEVTRDHKSILIKLKSKDGIAILEVTDEGIGILPEHLSQIFETFFSTKTIERGTGLGLATTKSIVEKELQGTITVKSSRGQGTVFTIEFPI